MSSWTFHYFELHSICHQCVFFTMRFFVLNSVLYKKIPKMFIIMNEKLNKMFLPSTTKPAIPITWPLKTNCFSQSKFIQGGCKNVIYAIGLKFLRRPDNIVFYNARNLHYTFIQTWGGLRNGNGNGNGTANPRRVVNAMLYQLSDAAPHRGFGVGGAVGYAKLHIFRTFKGDVCSIECQPGKETWQIWSRISESML